MSSQIQASNSLNILAEALCADLRHRHISVFRPHYIVTQTEGMNNWLRMQMAQNLGIAANYRFLKPNDLVNQLYAILGGEFSTLLNPANQSWLIFKILGERDFIKRFPKIASYYQTDGPDADLKRFALAEKVADLFDQYQIYRAKMMREWNGKSLAELNADQWQTYIWVKAAQSAGGQLPDKTAIGNFIIQELRQPEKQAMLQNRMPELSLFGLSVLTSFHLEIFNALGQWVNFSYYLINPAPNVYWFEDLSNKRLMQLKKKGFVEPYEEMQGNKLLTSWGKIIQHTFKMLFENEELINSYTELATAEPTSDTLLHKIQHELYHNLNDDARQNISESELKDGSVVINSCFTPAREVETLYNYLVALVDEKEERLSPRDVVVMVSDIDAYAPYIKAVFNNAPYKFGFTIADESFASNDTIAAALIALLEINPQKFHAEDVLQLLDFSYIRKRFGISDADLIRSVVAKANIRTGIKGDKLDDSHYMSWTYGLQRIIYGLCLGNQSEYFLDGDESIFPVDAVEGSASDELIRFIHFVQVLISTLEQRERHRPIDEWVKYVETLLLNLVFDPGENADEDYQALLGQLEQYNTATDLFGAEISYTIFSHSLLSAISASTRLGSFAGGGITFCSLIPMRSIPFKVIALLGLNFDKFPRKETQVSFNLITQHPLPGDRNVKDNDKHLFLETLLSAQDYLYISYIGQNVKDNSSLPPSALVDELLDYLQNKYVADDKVADVLVQKQALHHFSTKNFENGKINYLDIQHAMNHSLTVTKQQEELNFNELATHVFVNFFKNPIKAYFNRVLAIYYEDEETLLSSTEVFDLNHREKWQLKQDLLRCGNGPKEQEALRLRQLKTGNLPLKNFSRIAVAEVEEMVEPVRNLYLAATSGLSESTINIELEIPEANIKFNGSLSNIYGEKMVVVCWSSVAYKYLIDAYISYLFAQASGYNLKLYFINANTGRCYEAFYIDEQSAKAKLIDLHNLFIEGHQEILLFYADLGYGETDFDELHMGNLKKLLTKKFEKPEYSDVYTNIKYNEGFFEMDLETDGEKFEEFKRNFDTILKPAVKLFPTYFTKADGIK
ncbi:exodeoxyribonuclease V subunit gamma [Pelobium manganitolerans]|uniref:RecBCD enzyme subunit RecC n=1 Tax=Pelobium manganitolerans TaxID=1842495 RepID=A0A419S4H5_9SPHI|nr:exodeoxyribonuclease V subunit gamma [Pelobium manganitolerans]RKD14512.1 exodeoxyribonuclease V subunit gamma [Pelobium manganitolerans]